MNHEPQRLAARPDYLGVVDLEPSRSDFLSEAIAGLSRRPRTLPCKYFYDERGAALFQKICDLPEYYITRTETAILRLHAHEMADCIGPRCELIGLGTGAGTKTRILLDELDAPAVYIPVDISKEQLRRSTALFRKIFPGLEILPVCADYLESFDLPSPSRKAAREILYFPGSTIGNFEPADAIIFLRRLLDLCAENGALLIGVDLQKDRRVLERAYNDSAGVTAQFNLNLLARANRELRADFDLRQWQHYAIYNPDEGRIEIYVISRIQQTVHFAGREFHFNSGERIVTEFSYKYAPRQFIELARAAGFNFGQMWTDAAGLFGVFYFTAF